MKYLIPKWLYWFMIFALFISSFANLVGILRQS